MSTEEKRITLKLTQKRHDFIRSMSKPNDVTQEELMGIIIDVISVNPKAIQPHIERFKKKRDYEKQRQKELEARATRLLSTLTEEQQAKLLSGSLDLSKLV